jgi:alkanesulfonate monooxygenase SsuD/methylene tetrahydromethanopterin reductase-like flavin-dependent oxidoreductase (luciferase family)
VRRVDNLQLMAIAAAHHTKTARIGIGVSVLPFHHPLQLAEQGVMDVEVEK